MSFNRGDVLRRTQCRIHRPHPNLQPLGDFFDAHPVLSALDDPVLALHQDTFDLPPGAELLARTDGYPHAFAVGSALALQFHAEATPAIVAGWMERPGLRDLVARAGRDPDDLLDEVARFADRSRRQGMRIFEAWVAAVLG